MSYQPNANQTEGAVYTQGQVGIAGGVRKDATGAPSGVADGDVHPFVFNQEGRLKTSTQPAIYDAITGTITANGQTVSADVSRASNVMFHVTGTFSTVNCTFEGSLDGGTTWFTVQAVRSNANTIETTTGNLSATPAYAWEASVNALTNFRLRATAYTSGTQTWRILPGAYATEPIPAAQISGTQPVSLTSTTITSVIPTTAATALGKARDSAIGATDTGVAVLGVRRDAPTAETPVAGDYVVPQVSANGEQWVGMAASATNSPSKARDGVAGASDVGIPAQFIRRDAPTAVTPIAGDYEFAQISNLGGQYVHPVAHTAGGATPYKLVSAASTNATSVKASAGQIYSIAATNSNAAVRYLKLYNKASAPTVGTDTPVQVYMLPAGGGIALSIPVGMAFATGIAFAITSGAADSDSGTVLANENIVSLTYL